MPRYDAQALAGFIRDIPDFPEPGVMFKDITPLLGDAGAFRSLVDHFVEAATDLDVDQVVGMEARGFLLGTPVSYLLEAGFVPARKAGKLPSTTRGVTYALEYGNATLELHADSVGPGDRVLIVDDVLATGGTAAATVELVESLGATVVGVHVMLELSFLDGRSALGDTPVWSLLTV